jgi:transcriptional regulator with XRE-family HTH domain
MKKETNWGSYFNKQMDNDEMRRLVTEEPEVLRVGVQLAKPREGQGLSQTGLAAKVGMSGPNMSRMETSPGQNLTLGTLVKVAAALGHGVEVTFPPKRRRGKAGRSKSRRGPTQRALRRPGSRP